MRKTAVKPVEKTAETIHGRIYRNFHFQRRSVRELALYWGMETWEVEDIIREGVKRGWKRR